MEMETQDLYDTQKEDKPEDDLTYAPAPSEIEGTMWVKIVEGRDLNLPNGWYNKKISQKRGILLNLNILPSDLEPPLSSSVLKMIQHVPSTINIENDAVDGTETKTNTETKIEMESDQIEGDQGEGNKDDGDKTDKTTIIATTKLSMAYVNPGLGLSKYKPAYDIELDDDDESNKGRRGSMFTGRAGNETDSPTETIDSSNPQSDTGSIQMSLKENKNKKKVKGFADQKHKSHRLKNLEEKRRKRFFKMKSNMRDQEIKSRADTTLDQGNLNITLNIQQLKCS